MLKSTIALYNDSILTELLARYEVQLDDVSFAGGFDSYVYEFKRVDQSYILKISHSDRRTFEELGEEVEWLSYLERQGAPVCKVVPSTRSIYRNREVGQWFWDAYRVENPLEELVEVLDFSLIPDFLKLRHLIVYIGFLQTVEGKQLNEGEQGHLDHLRQVIEQDVPIIPFDFVAFLLQL